MKKLSFLFFSLLAIVLLTACNEDNSALSTKYFSCLTSSRAVNGENVTFSQGTTEVVVDYINSTIKLTFTYKDVDGETHNVVTPVMQTTIKNNSIYSFGPVENGLKGYFDFGTGMLWFMFDHDQATKVYCTSELLYAYATTTITNPDNGFNYNHKYSAYMISPDANDTTCTLWISNFTPNISGSVQEGEIKYKGLTMKPTEWGYVITADEAESNFKGNYTITDLKINLNDQGQTIDGSFNCADLEFKVNGPMFPLN